MVMFSGLVCVGMLTAFGSCTGTVLVITGMVIRKMMRSTSITSTSGVVLMLAIAPPSSPPPTFIAIFRSSRAAPQGTNRGARRHPVLSLAQPLTCERCATRSLGDRRCLGGSRPHAASHRGTAVDAGAAHQIGVQVAREVPQRLLQ